MNNNEMDKLIKRLPELSDKGLTFEVGELYGGPMVNFFKNGESWGDIVCHSYSYGNEQGLLEGGYGPFADECDDVKGYLTADDAFEIISKALNKALVCNIDDIDSGKYEGSNDKATKPIKDNFLPSLHGYR